MKATVDAKEFSQALNKVIKVIKQASIPELEGVLVSISNDRCTLTATDFTTWLTTTIPARGDDLSFVFQRPKDAARACGHFEGELILEAEEKIKEKLSFVAERSVHKVPYSSKDGVFDDWTNNIAWWTNGFWGGILWQLYHVTKNELYRESAQELEEKLDATLMSPEDMDHDSGFRWLLTSGANYRETGSEESFKRTLLAACNMAGRFNPAGDFIRAWNDWGNKEKRGENAGIAITPGVIFAWIFIATLAAVGNAGVPMGCFFLSASLLASMNVPILLMGVILPFYAVVDMIETTLNVWSDSSVAVAVNKDMKFSAPHQIGSAP